MHVRLLETEAERELVYKLTYQEYLRAGYIDKREDGRYVHYQGMLDALPQTDVFLAFDGSRLIGTNTLTRDSDGGIPADHDFPQQAEAERSTGKLLGSSWRLVIDRDYQGSSAVKDLIRAVIRQGVERGVETWLYSLNPRHALAYMKMLNARVIGFSDTTDGLHNAPALLLRNYTKDFPAHWLQN